MPQQLIYTSAPRGITSGRSGYCTVARSAEMRESLATHLEQLSYYQHQALTGGVERPVHAFRILDVRGTRCFVLSRIQDAGLDFTKRTNFLAHHLVFTPEEIAAVGSPPLLFLYWDGWKSSWDGEPELLSREDWGNLHTIKAFENDPDRHYETAPARSWKQLTGAAANAFGLLDLRGSAWLAANEESDEVLLRLLAESLRMMELRNRDTNYRAKAWQVTFTTNFQEQDNARDFQWKCFRREKHELAIKIVGSEVTELRECYSTAHSAEESLFADKGPCLPEFSVSLEDNYLIESSEITLHVKAVGIPYPDVEWLCAGKPLNAHTDHTDSGETWSTCSIRNLQPGTDQCYKIRLSNTYNKLTATCRVQVKALPSLVKSGAGKPPLTDTKPASIAPQDRTSQLIQQIIGESKKAGSTKQFWEFIKQLDENQEHKSFGDVRPDYLVALEDVCTRQKMNSTKRIAARCRSEIDNRTRKNRLERRRQIWKKAPPVALCILIIGGLVWLILFAYKTITLRGEPTPTAPAPKSLSNP